MLNINPQTITALQKEAIPQWKNAGITIASLNPYQDSTAFPESLLNDFYRFVEENHAFNFQLWDAEDRARREDKGHEFVYQAKRAIDGYNQQRNNRMEAMDQWLFQVLKPAQSDHCPVNSESPGMMIDRLSILALKAYHMNEQTLRVEVDEAHRSACVQKLVIIHQQLVQLSLCLKQLLDDVEAKTRTFRVYHQFKMYNDPKLNPELYSEAVSENEVSQS